MTKHLFLGILCLAAATVTRGQTVEFFTPNIVHIVKANGAKPKASLVVTAKPQAVKVKRSEEDGATVYRSEALTVTVKNGAVTFADAQGRELMHEGASALTPRTEGSDRDAYKVKQCFSLEADEPVYGVGMMQNGKMSLRGENRRMIQTNLEDFAHFYQTVKGYGIYWDNYSPTHLRTPDEGKAGFVELESEVGQAVDYYFLYGGNADGVVRLMRHLTGHVPMLPLWTYGFHQSRERYKSQAELLDVVHRYRQEGIPFDGIIQDWQYWGSNYTWNAMEFINEQFDHAQDMIDEVHRQNAHLSISIWASFGPQTKPYRELEAKGHLFSFETWPQSGLSFWPPRMDYPSGVRVYDPYSTEARDIYWKYLTQLQRMGIDAWWMDSTDPDHHSYKDSDLDERCALGSYRSVRNLFPFMTVGGVADHQRAADSTKRVFILTRSYFAGQQRYGANTWSGDVTSSWESFRRQVPICLNHTLTANPNVNTDIGGFFAGSYNKGWNDNSATRNPQYQELYVRWMQFGLFCPMMRSHGTEVYRELYHYGKAGEPVYDALLDAVKMRYRLLPYIYSQSWQVSKNDDSFMRALVMDFPNDRATWTNNREYMFGPSLLVCPVVDPLFTKEKVVKTDAMTGWNKTESADAPANNGFKGWQGTPHYEVYLPDFTAKRGGKHVIGRWTDFWAGAEHDGGQTLQADAPLSHSPLYVRSGSILPLAPDAQYANQKDWAKLTLLVFPGADATFTLYEDEGDGYNYEHGAYSTILLSWNDRTRTLTIGARKGSFEGMIASRSFEVKLPNGQERTINYKGKAVKVKL